ncbi:MAG: tripartite tricarboxylate transporter substrate binding protein [Betaproteobacteria bacterium]|nr:tripartite tricarboxylate transporter substrate binding protein [Betaproteobacteria bacterium]
MIIRLVALTWALLYAAASIAQSSYPSRPVRFIVPSSSGGGTDIITRAIAVKLAERLGQPFVIENRPGATGIIGYEMLAKADADGYTILTAASPITINPVLYKKVPYDVLKDYAPITLLATVPNILLVHPSVPAQSVKELIALAKAQPGHFHYASAGLGSSPHMSMELLKSMAGIDLAHVPYKGTGPGLIDLLAGRVAVMLTNVLSAVPHVKSGKLRALGVSGTRRSSVMPEVPTIAEAGVAGYEVMQWYGVLAPAGTPREIVLRLQAEIVRALELPDVKERLATDGAEAVGSTPEAFGVLIRSEVTRWAAVAKNAGIQPE